MAERARTFYLQRNEDLTGVSGTGIVADGVLWPDETVTVHWRGTYASDVYWPDGIEAVEQIHGHDGRTEIIWHVSNAATEPDYAAMVRVAAAATLREFAELIDRGPMIPLRPSIFSTMAREQADDIEAGRRG
ncbi:hypothetical protein [Labedaea rhizosphaerae]|uniref:Uncharacterized protein n=1 Tax=Labedaea rhizosphaerae TaxID=598644 RepID=A0A4R6SC68_LABRH|nr:hypothetical protein [Labedaea rhizosphaerae]TDP97659.1 hypothetical protein EV186_103623 [Labedaea rhizosphaerae]